VQGPDGHQDQYAFSGARRPDAASRRDFGRFICDHPIRVGALRVLKDLLLAIFRKCFLSPLTVERSPLTKDPRIICHDGLIGPQVTTVLQGIIHPTRSEKSRIKTKIGKKFLVNVCVSAAATRGRRRTIGRSSPAMRSPRRTSIGWLWTGRGLFTPGVNRLKMGA
jgi:hypothetical protein